MVGHVGAVASVLHGAWCSSHANVHSVWACTLCVCVCINIVHEQSLLHHGHSLRRMHSQQYILYVCCRTHQEHAWILTELLLLSNCTHRKHGTRGRTQSAGMVCPKGKVCCLPLQLTAVVCMCMQRCNLRTEDFCCRYNRFSVPE